MNKKKLSLNLISRNPLIVMIKPNLMIQIKKSVMESYLMNTLREVGLIKLLITFQRKKSDVLKSSERKSLIVII